MCVFGPAYPARRTLLEAQKVETYHTVPMHLPHCPLFQVHLGCSNIVALRKIRDDLFAHPSSLEYSGSRVGEAPFEVGHIPAVCGLSAEVIWVLQVDRLVGAPCVTPGSALGVNLDAPD